MEKKFKEKVKLHNIRHIVDKVPVPRHLEEGNDLSFEEIWMDKVDQIMFDEERERHKKKVR